MPDTLEHLQRFAEMEPKIHDEMLLCLLESHIERMATPEIQQLVVTACTRMHSPRTLEIALEATDMLISYLKARGMYSEYHPNKQTDTAIAATLMHNLFFDRTLYPNKKDWPWQNVFQNRATFEGLAKDIVGRDYQYDGYFEYIFQIIEAQLGELMPVTACRPANGQITYIVWEVLWFYYTFQYSKKNKDILDEGIMLIRKPEPNKGYFASYQVIANGKPLSTELNIPKSWLEDSLEIASSYLQGESIL